MLVPLPLLSHLSAKYHHLHPTAHNPNLPLPCRQAVAMAISIEELDVLVRSFYEGRGEQVRSSLHFATAAVNEFADHALLQQQKAAQAALNQVSHPVAPHAGTDNR